MGQKVKKYIGWVALLLAVGVVVLAVYINGLMCIITGYAAKNLCSAVFISGRNADSVESLDLNFSFIKYTNNTVSYADSSVTSRFLWGKSKAVYRKGFGVTILRGNNIQEYVNEKYPLDRRPKFLADTVDWPMGNRQAQNLDSSANYMALDSIGRALVDGQGYNGTPFAFVVVHNGALVAERYKQGFDMNTRLLSWSMAKSITNAMVGLAVDSGLVDVNAPLGLEEWKGDSREKITLNDLMQMQSGLEWNESYGSRSDVNLMLHREVDMGFYAQNKPLEFEPATHWVYSSGSTNIVCRYLKNVFNSDSAYYDLAMNKLLGQIGVQNAIFEVDMSGTLLGSSYVYAKARDYARFGLLYLNKGVFDGRRILPEGWVQYTTTPATASNGKYGAFFWLNAGKQMPDVPDDAFWCSGHDGQQIYMVPSKNLVVVVLGYSPRPSNMVDFNRLLKDIITKGID